MLLLLSVDFFSELLNILSGTLSECQTVRIPPGSKCLLMSLPFTLSN